MKTASINTIDELISALNELKTEVGGTAPVRLGTSYEDNKEEYEYQAYISVVELVDYDGIMVATIY